MRALVEQQVGYMRTEMAQEAASLRQVVEDQSQQVGGGGTRWGRVCKGVRRGGSLLVQVGGGEARRRIAIECELVSRAQ